jgi:hypothetical protein
VWDDEKRKTYVQNVAGHIKGVTKPEIVDRQRTFLNSPRMTLGLTANSFRFCCRRPGSV